MHNYKLPLDFLSKRIDILAEDLEGQINLMFK